MIICLDVVAEPVEQEAMYNFLATLSTMLANRESHPR